MKRKNCDCYQDFTHEEYEVSETLLLLKTGGLQEEKKKESKLEKTRSCKRNQTNNIISVSAQILNVVVINNGYNPPDLPPVRGLRNFIFGCSEPFEKQLKLSDLREDQNRLLLHKNHVETHFLPLLREDEDVKQGIEVIVYDEQGNMFNMTFKLWANKYYVLMGGWKTFFKSHGLQMLQDYVTVWMFRHSETNNLCFALSVRRQTQNI